MKKVIAVLLLGAMIMSVACKKKETTASTTSSETTQTTEDTTTETSIDLSDLLIAKLKTDPRDKDAGKLDLIQPLEPGNIRISSYTKATTEEELLNASFVVGEKTDLIVKYQAKDASKLTLYVLPIAEDFRWKKSSAVATATIDVASASEDTETKLTFTIAEGTESADYAFVFVENDNVVGYFQSMVLKDANDKKPF
ncbi:MAG: hypothetical protein IKD90_06630 [Clostridiales bacterium]|nr:hypothetical protein [Clostridiales bacterium]